jgi:hypothetical protein
MTPVSPDAERLMGPMRWRVTCWQCGGLGVIDGDCTCFDDTCCCLYPTAPRCDICEGEGSYIVSELTDDNYQDAIPVED